MLCNGVLHFGNVPRHEFPWELQRFIEVITCTVFIYIFNCYYFLHFSQGQDCTLGIFVAIIFLKGGMHMHFEIRCGETKFSSNSWSRPLFKNHLRLFRGVMKTKLSKIRQESGKKNKRISLYQLNTPKRVDNEGSHIALGCLKGASILVLRAIELGIIRNMQLQLLRYEGTAWTLEKPFQNEFSWRLLRWLDAKDWSLFASYRTFCCALSLPSSVCRTKQNGFLANSDFLGAK